MQFYKYNFYHKIPNNCTHAELGFESLCFRRWSRRLTLFYKILNNLTPLYTKEPIPTLHQSNYSLRHQDAVGRMRARTEKFKSSFYPDCISEWNKLDPEIRLAPSIAIFKTKLLSKIRPSAKSVFGIHNPAGLSYLSQILELTLDFIHKTGRFV